MLLLARPLLALLLLSLLHVDLTEARGVSISAAAASGVMAAAGGLGAGGARYRDENAEVSQTQIYLKYIHVCPVSGDAGHGLRSGRDRPHLGRLRHLPPGPETRLQDRGAGQELRRGQEGQV